MKKVKKGDYVEKCIQTMYINEKSKKGDYVEKCMKVSKFTCVFVNICLAFVCICVYIYIYIGRYF